MSWKQHHEESEGFASQADLALRENEPEAARRLYARAAACEERAVADLDQSKRRTLGISVVSAAALHYKSRDFSQAQAVACRWLVQSERLPEFAVRQLRTLLETVWVEERQDLLGVEFAPQRLLVSAQGGDVLRGGARLDLIAPTMQNVLSFLRRTAEFVHHTPFRKGGPQPAFIKDQFRPWVLQTAPGSYQFAVALQQSPRDGQVSNVHTFQTDVVDEAMVILATAAEDIGGAIHKAVPDPSYRQAFLKLARDLSPSGSTHKTLVVETTGRAAREHVVTLDSSTRGFFEEALQRDQREFHQKRSTVRLTGRLRAVDLNRRWIQLTQGKTTRRVTEVSDEVHNSVVELLDQQVVVHAIDRAGQLRFDRIELYRER